MLYRFAKILMTIGLRFFYRKIYTTGLDKIPTKGPVIIIANHASSLMDAALLGILLKRPAYFFARGDVFTNKPVRKILSWLHMMPVHAHSTSKNSLSVNEDSFNDGQKILTNGGIVVFFPESSSHPERQLLMFRKGVFRLAFKTATDNNFSFEIPIVSVGITYEHVIACRTEVQVHASAPLLLSDYKKLYEENPAATLLSIAKKAYAITNKNVLHIEQKNRLETAEYYLIINRSNSSSKHHEFFPWKTNSVTTLHNEQKICTYINNVPENEFENLKKQANFYFNELKINKLDDRIFSTSFTFPLWKKIVMVIGFPIYIIGIILNGLPIFIARKIADKKVYRQDFYSWIFVVGYSLLYLIWLVTIFLISLFWSWSFSIIFLGIMIVTGIFAYLYTCCKTAKKQSKQLKKLTPKQTNTFKSIRAALLAHHKQSFKCPQSF